MKISTKQPTYKKPVQTIMIFIISIIIGLTYTYITKTSDYELSQIQTGIADKIVRFHVVANSDSKEDQELKLKVKEAVVKYTESVLSNSKSIDESKSILEKETENILRICNQVIYENGYSYSVSAGLSNAYFPTKSYGQYTFPPGMYEAYQIKIGEAKGQNWWCVLYPPLCFIDISHGIVNEDSSSQLEETLSTEEFNAISGDCKVEFRFKYLKFLNVIFD